MEEENSWRRVVTFPLPGRVGKPREYGLTMVMDKGIGLLTTGEILEMAAEYVDFWKLTFGTSAFYPVKILREKIKLLRSFGLDVYPGGTFFELAYFQGKLDSFLEMALELGFTAVEISDGTVQFNRETRKTVIRQARKLGLKVLSEVGQKQAGSTIGFAEIRAAVAEDLKNGAAKVIIEGREGGKNIGIYGKEGEIVEREMEKILDQVSEPTCLIWEAPLKKQQQELILRFGPNVNLGNVAPTELLSLEALRVGMRSDTMAPSINDGRARRVAQMKTGATPGPAGGAGGVEAAGLNED